MYKRILAPLDGSPMGDKVIPYVKNLGKTFEAEVELFWVFDPRPEFFYPEPFLYQDRIDDSERYREEVLSAMYAAKNHLEAAGVAASVATRGPITSEIGGENVGHRFYTPADYIVMESEKDPDTLIVMSTHGRSGVGRWVMGSVTDKVLRAVKTPLLIIRGEGNDAPLKGTIGHIIVPLDGSEMAERILPHAVAWAKSLDAKVCLVQAVHDDKVDTEERGYLKKLAERIENEGVASVEVVVLHGDAATVIVDLTNDYPDALVAMTTHGRSGVSRWLIGSVADRVIRHAAGPVLVLRAGEQIE
ncbi:MAG: universal stress protein [Chloroflexi bacterium]|nr:universal stress protein [Chloroflexota bacterium]